MSTENAVASFFTRRLLHSEHRRVRSGVAGLVWTELGALGLLLCLSVALRTQRMGVRFWIDEGLSVQIAAHPLHLLPGLLRQDGAPPLYYALLHEWMLLFGDSERATHSLSLLCATLCVPAALWLGRTLFGPTAGWCAAILVASNPFLTSYAQETRMYALMVLLGLLATGTFVMAFVQRRRGARFAFGVLLALMLYTHNWALFFIAAAVACLAVLWLFEADRRSLLRDAAQALGLALLLYLPWLPTFFFQALHTGAPWAETPPTKTLTHAPGLLLGGQGGLLIVLLAGGVGLAAMVRLGGRSRREALVLVAIALLPILLAWVVSQASSVWATRYLAVAAGPILLLAATGLSRAGALGVVGLLLLTVNWVGLPGPVAKSNAHYVATTIGEQLQPGDVVLSTQPEQVPVLRYYLPPALRYATLTGPIADPGVVDWRDGVKRLSATTTAKDLEPLLAQLPVGARLAFVRPIVEYPSHWLAPWSSLVASRSDEWEQTVLSDPRLSLMETVPLIFQSAGPNPLQAFLLRKVHP